jgi:hypothetical protein
MLSACTRYRCTVQYILHIYWQQPLHTFPILAAPLTYILFTGSIHYVLVYTGNAHYCIYDTSCILATLLYTSCILAAPVTTYVQHLNWQNSLYITVYRQHPLCRTVNWQNPPVYRQQPLHTVHPEY